MPAPGWLKKLPAHGWNRTFKPPVKGRRFDSLCGKHNFQLARFGLVVTPEYTIPSHIIVTNYIDIERT